MKQSFSYYIILLVLKLKGIKKTFSKDPIDVNKVRAEDVHRPKGKFYKKFSVELEQTLKSKVTEIKVNPDSKELIIFIPGGAFISGPAQHHWDTLKEMVKQSNRIAWMLDYPKAPEHQISEISENIDAVYKKALEEYKAESITLIGDSVGGTLITALTQRLIKNNLPTPKQIILICPIMDCSLSNPEIDQLDLLDPMLSKVGMLSAKKLCAGDTPLKKEIISPLYGSFNNFPLTTIFVAEYDVSNPDQLLAIDKMKKSGLKVEIIEGKSMPHIWPLLPVMKEAKIALSSIIERL